MHNLDAAQLYKTLVQAFYESLYSLQKSSHSFVMMTRGDDSVLFQYQDEVCDINIVS